MFISYFHYSTICSLVNAIFFLNATFITNRKKSYWAAMLASGTGQSSHRLLLLLLVGQCTIILLSETLLCEGKNQHMLILFPSRNCSSCQ